LIASLVQATPYAIQKFKRRAMERLASTKLIFTLCLLVHNRTYYVAVHYFREGSINVVKGKTQGWHENFTMPAIVLSWLMERNLCSTRMFLSNMEKQTSFYLSDTNIPVN